MNVRIKPPKSKLPEVKTTIFSTIGVLARKYNATDLSQGFPNFEIDPELIRLVNESMHFGYNQYAPMQGHLGLREAISEKIEKLHKTRYHVDDEITITVGATQAIYTSIAAFVHPGDEVIILKPSYDSYEPSILANGGTPVPVQMSKGDYQVDWTELKEKISGKTRMMIINTPHNPSGRVFSKEEMLQLQEILRPTNIILISDEVYEHIVFNNYEHQSASRFEDLAQRSFVCASFGKTFHVTGWKVGYCVAPKDLMAEFRKVHQFAVYSIHHPIQNALATYLKQETNYLNLRKFYQDKRDLFLSALAGSKFKFTPTQGTYFQLLDYTNITSEDDDLLAERLIKEHQLASIPISSFNIDRRQDGVLRFCFAKKKETLLKAAEILCSLK
ncbi:methionine aminotransferase [Euzebyella saccharophila]|uniref:Methionine aminotransferase n=1 Tax=Euzebyella saccharophila TaxID=679664 RepID=A0ABV8JS33_9FLAO|nr:methionine aminotransferase [Euzebyella saccharophila]